MENRSSFIQKNLFAHILSQQGEQTTVSVLSEVLHLNKSAVYNRMSGAKMLRYDELLLLCEYFHIAPEHVLPARNGISSFQMGALGSPVANCRDYLSSLTQHFKTFEGLSQLRIWFCTNELPFFYHMQFKELALFKLFTYARINWQLPYMEKLKFDPDNFPERDVYDTYVSPILRAYFRLPTIEFWSDQLYDHSLKQIQYFAKSGQIANTNVEQILYEQLEILCHHQQEMAKQGLKFHYQNKRFERTSGMGALDLYYNEIIPTNITLLAESNTLKGVFTVFDDPNFMFNGDEQFYHYTLNWLKKLRMKSTRISEEAEHTRCNFFNHFRNRIDFYKRGPLML